MGTSHKSSINRVYCWLHLNLTSSCLPQQHPSTPSTSPRRTSSGSSRRPSRTKSYPYSELYHSLLKIFVDADTNRDGLVSKNSFSKLIDAAASMPRAYGYAPADSDLYKTEEAKDAARQKMFASMDLKATGVITFDEWLKFCREHIAAKTATMDPHPIIDQGSVDEYKKFIKAAIDNSSSAEAVELYWYMLEIFTEHDQQKEGFVKMENFASMMHEFLATPVKHGLKT